MPRLSTIVFACLAAITTGSTLGLGLIQAQHLEDVITGHVRRQHATLAEGLAGEIEQTIQRELRSAEALASVIDARHETLDADQLRPLLAAYRDRFSDPEIIVVGDSKGRGITSDRPGLKGGSVEGTDYSDRDYFQALVRTRRPSVSRVQIGKRTKHPNIHVAAPIGPKDAMRGYVALSLPLDPFLRIAERALSRIEGGRVVILDWERRVVVDTARAEPTEIQSAEPLPSNQDPRPETSTHSGRDDLGIDVDGAMATAEIADNAWTVFVTQPSAVTRAEAADAKRRGAGVAAAVLALGLLVSFLLSAWIARPIARISAIASRVGSDALGCEEIPRGRMDPMEAVELGRALSAMIGRLGAHANELKAKVQERTRSLEQKTKDLEAAKNEAMTASRLKSEFIANMSHEIRTPMNGILGTARLLLETSTTAEQKEYAEAALLSGNTLLGLLNDILDFSKIEAGKLRFELMPFDLAQLLEEVVYVSRSKAGEQGLELLPRIRSSVPRMVMGDPGRVRQVINNLVGNALKFTEKGYVEIEIDGHAEGPNARVIIRIRDTGIGIPEDRLDHIFAEFSQADASTTRRFGGTGLGLAIVRRLAESMGGDVRVESRLGEGSTFTVQLLLRIADVAPSVPRLDPLPSQPALLVSNNERPLALLVEQLEALGVASEIVSTPEAALRRLEDPDRSFSFMVVDADLGHEVAALARHPRCPPKALWERPSSPSSTERGDDWDRVLLRPTALARLAELLMDLLTPSDTESTTETIVPPSSGRGRVLVVEDNRINQLIASRMLVRLGLEVEVAADGFGALHALEERTFDLVMMDCQMPRMDGYEATQRIRSSQGSRGRVPIVALTANALSADRDRCLAIGMDDHLAKPLTLESLALMVDRWLIQPSGVSPQSKR